MADQDCAIGSCLETGAGFSECVIPLPCGSNLDCAPLNGPGLSFVCVDGISDAGRRCINIAPFSGSNCADDSGCPEGQRCYWYSPHQTDPTHGECRVPCDGGQPCSARGGIPHICLAGGEGGCFPTNFGMPCADSADCLAEFTCTAVSPDDRTHLTSPTICTMSCAVDADCMTHPLIRVNGGFCKEGVCRLTGQKGVPCDRNTQCVNSLCAVDSGGVGQCAI